MAKLTIDGKSDIITKERMESVRFVQNTSKSLLMVPDLGKKGVALHPDEIVDLNKSFSKKEIGQSQNLAWCIEQGHVTILKHIENEDGSIELDGVIEDKNKYKAQGDGLPKNVPVEDRKVNVYDKSLDKVEDDMEREEDESKPGRRGRSRDREEEKSEDKE